MRHPPQHPSSNGLVGPALAGERLPWQKLQGFQLHCEFVKVLSSDLFAQWARLRMEFPLPLSPVMARTLL